MDKAIQKLLQENQLTHWKMVSENSNQKHGDYSLDKPCPCLAAWLQSK